MTMELAGMWRLKNEIKWRSMKVLESSPAVWGDHS